MTSSEIIKRYSWQFRVGRGIDHCVPPPWLPVVEELCMAIERTVPMADRPAFCWLDIKEKRGELAVDYVVPATMADVIEALVDSSIARASQVMEKN